MLVMKRRLRSSWFTYLLDKTYPKSYSDMLICAQKYIHVKEGTLIWWEDNEKSKIRKSKESQVVVRSKSLTHPTDKVLSQKNLVSKYDNYTPLLVPRTNILMEIEREWYLRRPLPMRATPTSRNKNKYRRFYWDHSHGTENCIALKNEIKDLIQCGYLGNYIYKKKLGLMLKILPNTEPRLKLIIRW